MKTAYICSPYSRHETEQTVCARVNRCAIQSYADYTAFIHYGVFDDNGPGSAS